MSEKSLERARRWTAAGFRFLSVAVLLVGLGLVAYAGVQWLQTEHWHPLTVSGVLDTWPTTRAWVAHPQSWQGLHRIVRYVLRVPLYLIVTGLGLVMLIFSRA